MGEWMYTSTFSWPRHQLEVSGQFYPPGTHWIGGWVDPRTGLGRCKEEILYPAGTWTPIPHSSTPVASRKGIIRCFKITIYKWGNCFASVSWYLVVAMRSRLCECAFKVTGCSACYAARPSCSYPFYRRGVFNRTSPEFRESSHSKL
jgi:hypothetical protein